MIIRNYRELAQSRAKANTLKILEAGLEAASPVQALHEHVTKNGILVGDGIIDASRHAGTYIVALGKAADRMADALDSAMDTNGGIVVMPRGLRAKVGGRRFKVFHSGHPVPDRNSVAAAKYILKFLRSRKRSDLVVFLVSGGSSSMLCLPDGIELSDKIYVTDLLLKSGASIREINCVRKHLSKVKGGRLVREMACSGTALVLSDVPGDDLSSIASGVTYCDPTTFADARSVIERYGLTAKFPRGALERISLGERGEIPETPKEPVIPHQIIANNTRCLDAMAHRAGQLGYDTRTISVSGWIKDAVREIKKNVPVEEKSCLIFGGETTVKVIGDGKGGRNQEIVLRLLKNLQKTDDSLVMASVGTDGIDGNTEYAGALVENFAIDSGTINSYLRRSDSSSFFAEYGGRVLTGQTRSNLMDVGIILTH